MPAAPQSPRQTHPAGLAPERSLTQRMDALKRANEIRTRRAQLKRDLRRARIQIHGLLLDPPEYVLTAKVFDLLLAVPKYGRVKVNRILTQCRISPSKTIGGLSERQRNELVSLPAPIAPRGAWPPSLVITGPSGVGKGTLIKRPPRAHSRARAVGVGDHAHAAPGRGRTASTTTSSAAEDFDGASQAGSSSSTPSTRETATGRCVASSSGAGARLIVLEIDVQGARQVRERAARRGPDLHRAAVGRGAERRAWSARGSDSPEQIERRCAAARRSSPPRTSSTTGRQRRSASAASWRSSRELAATIKLPLR